MISIVDYMVSSCGRRPLRNLDTRDQGLLSLLRADARLAVAELAKRLGVSRATVLNRMRRLEREGVILGYTVKLSDEIGNQPVRALMSIRVDSKCEARVIGSLRGKAVRNLDARDQGANVVVAARRRALGRGGTGEATSGVSRATVLNRMRRLEREGVILGYTVKLSDEIGNLQPVRALMTRTCPQFITQRADGT